MGALAAALAVALSLGVASGDSPPARGLLGRVAPLEGPLLLQVPVLLLVTAAHELGHLLAARAAGVAVTAWRIGPLLALRSARGWRLRLVRSLAPGGHVQTGAVTGAGGLRARHAAVMAGGPAAHLALAALATGLAVPAGAPALWLTAGTLWLSFAADLLPLAGPGGAWTDGRWLLAWLRSPGRAAQRLATGVLLAELARGRRPREWDERWVTLAAAGHRQPADGTHATGCALAYAWALDRGDVDAAARFITRAFSARSRLSSRSRTAMAAETAFFVARYRRDARLAARLMEVDRAGLGRAREADRERAGAAIHLAAGRPAEALAACDRALRALDREGGRPQGRSPFGRELVLAMSEEARAALDGGSSPARAAVI